MKKEEKERLKKLISEHTDPRKTEIQDEDPGINYADEFIGTTLEIRHDIAYFIVACLKIIVQKRDKEKTNLQVVGINLPFMVDKQEKVSLARADTAVMNIVPYLDEVYGITDSFEKARKTLAGAKSTYVEWIEFKYLKMVLELTKCKLDEIGVF